MDYLIDKYIKKPDYVKELLDQMVTVSLKIDGSAFQIFYNKEEDKLEYHKRGGSSSKLGPIIDEYTQLFTKHLNDAIDFFDSKKNLLKENKFYAIEIFNNMYVLLTVIDHNDNIITEVSDIARKLNIESLPILFNGKLSDSNDIISLCMLDEKTTNEDFILLIKKIFGRGNYEKFFNGDEVEGIVLTWVIDNKPVQYKIINPAFKTRHEADQKKAREEAEKDTKQLNKLIELLYNRLIDVAKHRDDNWIKNLDLNFLEMISDPNWVQDIKNIAKEITPNTNKWFMLQMDKVNKDVKKYLENNGEVSKIIYEKYLMTFNKPKKKVFIISKEFQNNINNIIEKMQQKNESLRLYTKLNINGINKYINEKLNINKNSKIISYKYYPKTRDELKKLIKQLIKERGNKANLNDISVSEITNMSTLFYESNFNGDISKWDVSNVTDMSFMFFNSKFNGNIKDWDVSNVTNMDSMFCGSQFNSDISEWDVSNVKYMQAMFNCSNFNGDISQWNINNVTNMNYIFNDSPIEKNTPKWYKE